MLDPARIKADGCPDSGGHADYAVREGSSARVAGAGAHDRPSVIAPVRGDAGRDQSRQLTGEPDSAGSVGEVQRLDAEAVPRQQHAAIRNIQHRERKLPV